MLSFANDLKLALRSLRQRPGFTVTVVAALTLGIGVNVAIFSVVNTVLLKPLPLPDQDSIVWPENTQNGVATGFAASPAKFLFWRSQTDVFQDVAAFRDFAMNYLGGDTPEQLAAQQISESFFRVYGGHFVRGRPFTLEEDLPGGPKVAVISHRFWQRHFKGAEEAIGSTLLLNGDRYTIIGITGSEFDLRDFAADPDVWVPFQIDPNSTSQAVFIGAGARLKPEVTLAEAQVRLAASAVVYRERFPGAMQKDAGFTVLPLSDAIILGDARKGLWVLLGAVGFVLLVACANVANLMLARANGRRREIAIRSTLGAGRWHIVRQLLAESVLVALLSGVLGLTVGFVGMRALLTVNTAGLIRLGQGGSLVTLDWRIATFALVVSLVTAVLFGLVPALINSRPNLNAVIKDSSGPSGSGFGQRRARSVLVAMEVGLAVVLLIGAALMIRTSIALTNVDPGFDPSNTVVMRTSLSGSRFESAESVAQLTSAALERVRAMPGVANAAATCCVPLQGGMGLPFKIQGRADNGSPVTGAAGYITATADYFKTFGIQVVRGRSFTESDNATALPVAIINETMAKRLWADGRDPLEDSLLLGANAQEAFKGEPIRRIVGIVRDVAWFGLGNTPAPIMYEPLAQMPDRANAFVSNLMPLTWVVRSAAPSAALQNAVQNEIRQAIGLPVVSVQSMDDVVKVATSRQRLNMLLMSVFGGAALVIATIGIYGLITYSVQQRKHEIGIRMALGADGGNIRGTVLREGLVVTASGVAAGVLASFYMANVLAALLFEVKPRDPVAFVAVPVVLTLVALFAVWLPAVRASRVSPLDALRYE